MSSRNQKDRRGKGSRQDPVSGCVVFFDCYHKTPLSITAANYILILKYLQKLPQDRQSLVLQELFGNQSLLTRPSNRNGMQYLLCVEPYRFQVHVGYSQTGEPIIRAFRKNYSLQLIHRERFRNGVHSDLPGPLVDDCFHWL